MQTGHVTKSNKFCNFLCASHDHSAFPDFLIGKNWLLKEVIPIKKGGENENGRVFSPESVPSHLK